MAVSAGAGVGGACGVSGLTNETNATARGLYDKVADYPGFVQYRKLF